MSDQRLEILLAGLLRYGSWLASAAIGLGLLFSSIPGLSSPAYLHVAAAGIVLFVLLPTLRVLLMLFVFLRQRDYRLALAAALVLTTILSGTIITSRVYR